MSKPKQLSNLSDEATEKTNQTGVMDPILEIDPDDGTMLRLLNDALAGEEGLALYLKLRDSGDNKLPTNTELLLEAERATDDSRRAVSVKNDNISAWNTLSLKEQRDTEFIDQVKVELQGEAINIRPMDTLYLSLKGSTAIDWSNSEAYFERKGVRELSYEG
jgi:hypothetical protein